MKKTPILQSLVFACGCLALIPAANAATIEQSTIMEVVKHVDVIEAAGNRQKAAKPQDVFRIHDVMRTGSESRAEMIAPDQTVTRIGANTVFSFSPEKREINLQRGSVLFSSPTGKGGGTIKTGAATASVLGTTIIVVTTKNGGFKLLVLDGHAKAKLPNGKERILNAGQLTLIMPGSTDFGPAYNFRLGQQVGSARLVNGFKKPLPAMAKIEAAIAKQEHQIASGTFIATNLLVGEGGQPVDSNLRQTASTVQTQAPDPLLALATDAMIDTATLDLNRVFTFSSNSSFHGIDEQGPQGIQFTPGNDFAFFLARNTTITARFINLSPYEGFAAFGFFSQGDTNIQGSLDFTGLPATPVVILAVGAINIAPGSSITFHSNDTASPNSDGTISSGLISGAPLALDDVTLDNSVGGIEVSAESITAANGSSIFAKGPIRVFSRSDLSIMGSTTRRSVIQSSFGAVGFFEGSQSSISLEAVADLNAVNTNFIGSQISLQARTINLTNVDFSSGSRVNLASQNGVLTANPNTGQPSVPGNVNFINGVTYGGQPAQNFVGPAGGASGPINISKR